MRHLVVAACALACAFVALPGAFAQGAEPIVLGTTAPAPGLQAYLAHVNARGGVAGRQVELVVQQDVRELGDVLAVVGQAGTEEALEARAFLAARRIPQLFVGSGGSAFAKGRWSIGFGPGAAAEGSVYGRFVGRTLGRAKVGVLVRSGDVDGVELVSGLRRGLAGSRASIVRIEAYEEGEEKNLRPQMLALRAAGAGVLAVFAEPEDAPQAFVAARRIGWRPPVVVSGESDFAAGEGAVTLRFVKDPSDREWADDPGMRLYRMVLARHARTASARDLANVQGMAVAFETVALLRRLGATPSRPALMAAARSITSPGNPFLLPGISVRTSRTDAHPIEQGRLARRMNGRWRAFGGLWSTG